MYIPVFTNVKYVEPSGLLTVNAQIYNDTLNQSLRTCLSDNGWTIPQLTQAQITTISADMPNGSVWYDITNNVFVGKQNGTLVKFTTAVWP